MAWNTNSTGYVTGAALPAALFNGIGLDLRYWGGNVDAGGYNLTNLAQIHGASNVLGLYTNSTERVHINSSGSVGIATASPTSALDVNGVIGVRDSGTRTFFGGLCSEASGQLVNFGINDDSSNRFGAYTQANQGGFLRFDARSAATPCAIYLRAAAGTTASLVMAMLTNGYVGIGTATPTSPLQVMGVPTYASDAAAGTAGLTAGAMYKDSGGGMHIKL